MAQFGQLFSFVHDMFYNAPSRLGVNWNPIFVNHSQDAGALIKLTHTRHVAPQLVTCSHAG
jgi:hypothetical protein